MLHTPHRNSGSSRYCGPTAIMCVTGERGSDVVAAVRKARGNPLTEDGRPTDNGVVTIPVRFNLG